MQGNGKMLQYLYVWYCILGHTKLIFCFWSACGSISHAGRFVGMSTKVWGWAENEYNGLGASSLVVSTQVE